MNVEDFDLLVGVIHPELYRKRATNIDRHLPTDGIMLDVIRAMSGKIANFNQSVSDRAPVGLREPFHEYDHVVIDEQPEQGHICRSVLFGRQSTVEFVDGNPALGIPIIDLPCEHPAVSGILTILERQEKRHDPGTVGRRKTGEFLFQDLNAHERTVNPGSRDARAETKRGPSLPFEIIAATRPGEVNGFIRHLGSKAFVRALQRDGARIDLDFWFKQWREQARLYQEQSKRYWLYR
jgi:hypothetical protein